MVDDAMGGGPRPPLPAGGTTTMDAGADSATMDAAAGDAATEDVATADTATSDAAPSEDSGLSDAAATPPGATADDGGGCTTGRAAPNSALGFAIALGALMRRRRR